MSELTWNALLNHSILEYKILKYHGDLGHPNTFIPLSEEITDRTVELPLGQFSTQSIKRRFTSNTFDELHRIRGIECTSKAGLAEAFCCRSWIFDPL